MPNPEYLDQLNRIPSRARVSESLPAGWADLPASVPADIDGRFTTAIEYDDPAPPPRRRPLEDFVPTPPAYDFESDPRNTYDH